MEKHDPRDRLAENDAFWDIDRMLPERKPPRRFSDDTEAVTVPLERDASERDGQPIPPPDSVRRRAIAEAALRKAEEKLHILSAAAPSDRKTAREEWERRAADRRPARDGISPNEADRRPTRDGISPSEADRRPTRDGISPKEAGGSANDVLYEYTPVHNPLLLAVTVRNWPARYSFYERFRADAVRYHTAPVDGGAPLVSFFSYTPQYSQLSDRQLACYLRWRQEVREGRYPNVDFAYILLYIYEILNLPDLIPPEEGAERLCRLWQAYRGGYPKLDRILPDWLCDYCLIGRIDPPALCRDLIDPSSGSLFLREYYAGCEAGGASPYAAVLFSCASDYNYRSGKYITPENREIFDRHIRGAFLYAFGKAEEEKMPVFIPLGKRAMTELTITRDAYQGAVCAYHIKRRIGLTYYSCSRSVELRFAVTDLIKYAENHVRALLGIRSRFHTPNLAMPLRRAVDEYFAALKKQTAKPAPPPEYEKLYEAEESDFSLDYAKRLEERSWTTTGLLVGEEDDAFTSPQMPQTAAAAPVGISQPDGVTPTGVPQALDRDSLRAALEAVLRQDMSRFAALAAERNLLPDTLAEQINDALYDDFLDAVVYPDGNRFLPVPDYTEDLEEWMKK